jgi:hypothetical protein
MENGVPMAEFAENRGENARVEAGTPWGRTHSYTVGPEAAGQLGIRAGDDHLIDAAPAELARQQPDLPLSATPLPAGGDVDYGERHVLGSTSAGKGSPSRAAA